MKNTIGIAADHAGYEMKEFLVGLLGSKGFEVLDFGCTSEESIDYPDYAHPLARAMASGEVERGVALCGSGQGMNLVLNKHKAVRAALCWSVDIARLSREHNDSNVLILPARFIDLDEASALLDIWLTTPFEGGRHVARVEKITSGL